MSFASTGYLRHAPSLVMAAAIAIQPTAASAGAQAAETRSFALDLPAQPLGAALRAFAKATRQQVVFDERALRGRRSAAVKGSYSIAEGLARLLAGSGATSETGQSGVLIVRATPLELGAADDSAGDVAPTREAIRSGDEIVVVGSHLKGIDPASPVIVIDAQTIARRGFSNIEDVLRSLPQNFSSRTSAAADLGQYEYGDSTLYTPNVLGNSSANLRGLGSGSTLVLVNGRRRASSSSGQGAYTDLSSIPLSQIERVEILTDGASAIYGADAVAGVVNIVLKKDYSGTTIEGRYENSSTGGHVRRLSGGHSFGWSSGSLTASADWRQTEPADVRSRIRAGDEGVGDFRRYGGTNRRVENVGQPGTVFESPDQSLFSIGDLIGLIPAGQDGTALDPDQLEAPGSRSTPGFYDHKRVGPDLKAMSGRLSATQDLTSTLRLDVGLGYSFQANEENWQASLTDLGVTGAGYATFVPSDNIYNRFGRAVLVGYSYARELEGITLSEEQRQRNLDANARLSGTVTGNWTFEADYTFGREVGRTDGLSSNRDENSAAVQTVLRELNVFGDGTDEAIVSENRQLLQSLIYRDRYDYESRIHSFDGIVRGGVIALPGGMAQLAVGGQYRIEDNAYRVLSEDGAGDYTRDDDFVSDRKVRAAFAELGLPVFPGLTVTLAARYEHFEQTGSSQLFNYGSEITDSGIVDLAALGGFDLAALTGLPAVPVDEDGPQTRNSGTFSQTSPQIRMSWKPVDQLKLRGTWGKSFLAPLPSQQFGEITVNNSTGVLDYNDIAIPLGGTSIVSITGVNNNLKPQIATTWTAGFDFTPNLVPDQLTVSVTYNSINFKNYIGSPLEAAGGFVDAYSNPELLPEGTFTLGENGVVLADLRSTNLASRRSRTIDFLVNYTKPTGFGVISLALNTTRSIELEVRARAADPGRNLVGTELGPSEWVGDLSLGWERGGFSASVAAHYSSPFDVVDGYAREFPDYYENPQTRADGYTTFDLMGGYRFAAGWTKGLQVQAGVQNVFDAEWPFVDNNQGFAANRVDVRGRVAYLNIRKEF